MRNWSLPKKIITAASWLKTADDQAGWKIKGDPTEGALAVLAAKAGVSKESLSSLYRRVREIPFDSERKRMSVVVEHQGGRLLCTKGAPDVLLNNCKYILWDGKLQWLDEKLRRQVEEANEAMAKSALRVIRVCVS